MAKRRDIETSVCTFNNANPKNRLTTGDCVVRAITLATGKAWTEVMTDLTEIGLKDCRVFNDSKVYEAYLSKQGFLKMAQPRKADNSKYTIEELCRKLKKSRYSKPVVVSCANHLTVIIDYKVNDTWDCTSKTVGNFWAKDYIGI